MLLHRILTIRITNRRLRHSDSLIKAATESTVIMPENQPLPQISINDCSPVPVFNCHIALRKDEATGKITARVANFEGIEAVGTSERDILRSLAKQFKEAVQKHHEADEKIPLLDRPQIQPGESERFLPIHL